MKKLLYPFAFALTAFLILYSCSAEEEDTTPPPQVQQPTPEPEPEVSQFTLTVTAGEGGTVSTEGGTYDEGTEVTITATPAEGFSFVRWEGSDSDSNSLNITLNGNTTLQALFAQLPILILPSSPSKMFTKGVADTLSIGFTSAAGFKSVNVEANYGTVEVLEQPEEGANDGNIVVQYTPLSIKNVDYMTTIAGYDELNITLTSEENIQKMGIYNIRTQPEPIFKNYNQPSNILANTRIAINPPLVRYLNRKDNSQIERCQYINGGLNKFGNLSDDYGGIAFADVNGDGYEDMFLHPVYTDGGAGGFSQLKNEYELYLYSDGEYIFHEINWEGNNIPKVHLARKILIGDYDNDGDPDFFSTNYGIDGPPYDVEKSLFIINDFVNNQQFRFKEEPHNEGSHSSSSADIDNDGDLDIFNPGRQGNTDPYTPFLRNDGNFEFNLWSSRYSNESHILLDDTLDLSFFGEPYEPWQYHYFLNFRTSSELVDINKDGYIDLIMGTDEDIERFTVLWGNEKGFNTKNKTIIPKPEYEVSWGMGHLVDIKIFDLDNDGNNEIILVRSGSELVNGNLENFYDGWYIQIIKENNNQFTDITSSIIDGFYSDQIEDYCGNPENNWIYWLNISDLDNNGNLDIHNKMMANRPFHRWEWNGSKFIKVSP